MNTQIPVTVQSVVAAVEQMRDQMKWCSPTQLVAKQAGIDQHQADVVVSVLSRRQLDQRYAVEDAVTVAKYILAQGWAFGPYSIDLCLSNLGNTPGGAKVHWVRKLQDREKEVLAEREKNRADLADRKEDLAETQRLSEQANELMHPEIRLSEKAKAHREMMNRPPQKVQMTPPAEHTPYWKARCESAIASLPVMDRAEAQQLLDAKKGGSYESAYSFIMTFVNRRAHERANAASLARMGR